MTLRYALCAFLIGVSSTAFAAEAPPAWVDLAGEWRFALDAQNEGVAQAWFQRDLDDHIQLPGTTDLARKGPANEARETGRLTRLHPYVGPAWYQRDLEVPPTWRGKRVTLVLERTKASRVWLDGKPIGEQSSLVAAHTFALGTLTPGKRRLTVRINNAEIPPIGDAHQISDQTQSNWNGIVGQIGLRLTDAVWIEDVQVYPDRAAKKVHVRAEVGNATGTAAKGMLTLSAAIAGGLAALVADVETPFVARGPKTVVEADVVLGPSAREWDEFSPVLYNLTATLAATSLRRSLADTRTVPFGLREFKAAGTQFSVNGKKVFLRGRADSAVFPLTGHPPMNVEGWRTLLQTAKSYGLNHVRFHTWCPPHAAFQAADGFGIYLQPELPNWAAFGEPAHDDFLRAEGERLLREFGNHPSFVMLSLGNELGGKQEAMAPVVKYLQSLDARHLYAQGTNNWFPGPGESDDYYASFQYQSKKLRGSYATVDAPLGHVQVGPPATTKDYVSEIAGLTVPVVSHEIGEYQVAPDFREIDKYTGVLRPRNIEALRERLKQAGMLDQANDFLRASGALAVLCYREDIEAALRTRGFGGFQLLDLMDFPGQGTALVGILNSLMESKGLIEPAKWREFCSPTVPLLRLPKYVYTSGETVKATVDVAHFGPNDLASPAPTWTLRDGAGHLLASGSLSNKPVAAGAVTSLGELEIPLKKFDAPLRLNLEIAFIGSNARNSYPLWVYPDAVDMTPGAVLISRALDEPTRLALAAGKSVLLVPEPATLPNSVEGAFASDFWNFGMFRKFAEERGKPVAPGTLGILCDPKHAAFERFPTDAYSNWQWFHLLQGSRALVLDTLPAGYRPLVQVIDNFERAHKLGSVLELKVGEGKLMVSSIDLVGQRDRPEARQLLNSLLAYMNSPQFNPSTQVDVAIVEGLLR